MSVALVLVVVVVLVRVLVMLIAVVVVVAIGNGVRSVPVFEKVLLWSSRLHSFRLYAGKMKNKTLVWWFSRRHLLRLCGLIIKR